MRIGKTAQFYRNYAESAISQMVIFVKTNSSDYEQKIQNEDKGW